VKNCGDSLDQVAAAPATFCRLCKLRGGKAALGHFWNYFYCRQALFRLEKVDLFRFRLPKYPFRRPPGVSIELKEITEPDTIIFPPEINIPSAVLRNRLAAGARIYGAFWNGELVDYCWSVTGKIFHEISEGLVFLLKENESYFFDYRGIRKGRPLAFSRFVLMKALLLYMFRKEEEKAGRSLFFYSIVDIDNRPSQAFHSRYLNARSLACLRLIIIFGKRLWKIPSSVSSLIKSIKEMSAEADDEKLDLIKNEE